MLPEGSLKRRLQDLADGHKRDLSRPAKENEGHGRDER
jgi:hypothetical protein